MKCYITKQIFTKEKFQQFCVLLASILFISPAFAALLVDKLNLISKQRVDRTHYEYTYSVNVINTGPLFATAVTATVTSSALSSTTIDGALSFGDIPAGLTHTSVDTFTFKQDRRVAFDPTVLLFDLRSVSSDVIPPEVVSVTPAHGSVNVNTSDRAMLIFSEKLDPGTVSSKTVNMFANNSRLFFPDIVGPGVEGGETTLADGSIVSTVTSRFGGQFPAGSLIQVAVSSNVKDLSGNVVVPFLSEFYTLPVSDLNQPFVVTQRPSNGANNIPLNSTVVLLLNEPLDVATVPAALVVLQNGVVVNGTSQVTTNGQVVVFTPTIPFISDAVVDITLKGAMDVSGNLLVNYQGSFSTVIDPVLSRPTVVRDSLLSMGSSVNSVLEVEFNEALNAATVDSTTVLLRESSTGGAIISAVVSMRNDRTIRVTPNVLLVANMAYTLDILNGIQDFQGQTPSNSTDPATIIYQGFFTTGSQNDVVAPALAKISISDGMVGVPRNAQIRLRFSESINPLTVDNTSLLLSDGINPVAYDAIISNSDREILLVPNSLLTENNLNNLTISGIEDRAGNKVAIQTINFTSTLSISTVGPSLKSHSPAGRGVVRYPFLTDYWQLVRSPKPVNSLVTFAFDRPVDLLTVTGIPIVRDDLTLQNVPGTLSIGVNGRDIDFTPDVPYTIGNTYTVLEAGLLNAVQDLAGNNVPTRTFHNFSFTTSFDVADITAPVVGVSPINGAVSVPLNAQLQIQLNESPNARTSGVSLSANGVLVPITVKFEPDHFMTLRTKKLLDPLTLYTIGIEGVRDLAGNTLPTTLSTFTTGTTFDLITPVFIQSSIDGSVNVPVNTVVRVNFDDVINALSANSTNLFLQGPTGRVSASVVVAANGLSATITPDGLLSPSTLYFVSNLVNNRLSLNPYVLKDLAGNLIITSYISGSRAVISFTTAP